MRVAQLVTMGLGRGHQAEGHFIMFQAADCPLPRVLAPPHNIFHCLNMTVTVIFVYINIFIASKYLFLFIPDVRKVDSRLCKSPSPVSGNWPIKDVRGVGSAGTSSPVKHSNGPTPGFITRSLMSTSFLFSFSFILPPPTTATEANHCCDPTSYPHLSCDMFL